MNDIFEFKCFKDFGPTIVLAALLTLNVSFADDVVKKDEHTATFTKTVTQDLDVQEQKRLLDIYKAELSDLQEKYATLIVDAEEKISEAAAVGVFVSAEDKKAFEDAHPVNNGSLNWSDISNP